MVGIFVPFHGIELFVNLAALYKGVEDIKDGVAAPGVRIIAQELGFFAGGFGSGDAVAIPAEGFELIDELVNYVPCPVVLECPLDIA